MSGKIGGDIAPRTGTLVRLLSELSFFKHWQLEDIRAVEKHTALLELKAESTLLELSSLSPFSFFLLKGELGLVNVQTERRVLTPSDFDANFPVANLRPCLYEVSCLTDCTLLRFESAQLRRFGNQLKSARFQLASYSSGGTWTQHPLVAELSKRIAEKKLPLPSMPGITVRVRNAMADKDIAMETVAKIIVADPAIAARMVKLSNSAVFGAASACDSVQVAMVRLGIERSSNLVAAIALKGLFVSKVKLVKQRLLTNWQHSIQIAAMSAILAKLTPQLDEDRALLIGLLHEIGAIPILQLAEAYPDLEQTPGILDEILAVMVPRVSGMILDQWAFHADFKDAAENATNWYRDDQGGGNYTDALVIAHLHALVSKREIHELPRLDETPAFQKLTLGSLSAKLSLLVLDESRIRIRELQTLLG